MDQCQLKSDLKSSVLLSASPPSLRLQMYVTSFSLYYVYFILYSNENFIPHPRQKVCKRTLMRRQFVCRSFPSSPCFAHLPKTFLNSTVTETEPNLGRKHNCEIISGSVNCLILSSVIFLSVVLRGKELLISGPAYRYRYIGMVYIASVYRHMANMLQTLPTIMIMGPAQAA